MITTIKNGSVDFDAIVSDKSTGSVFRNIASGINTPKEISIRHQDYVDSKTKKVGRRTVLRKDVFIEMSDGTIAPVSAMVIAMIPRDVNVTQDVVNDALSVTANCHGDHAVGAFDTIGGSVFSEAQQ